MSSEKFTPGEWTVACNGNIVLVVVKGTEQENIPDVVCSCGTNNIYKRKNAVFISVAPDMYRNNEQTLTELDQMIPAMLAVCAECNHRNCKICRFAKVLKTASEMERRIEQVQKKARGEEWRK